MFTKDVEVTKQELATEWANRPASDQSHLINLMAIELENAFPSAMDWDSHVDQISRGLTSNGRDLIDGLAVYFQTK